jgi:hypothetical protein
MLIRILAATLLLSSTAHAAQKPVPLRPLTDAVLNKTLKSGEALQSRADGDLNGDGDPDTAYVVISDDMASIRLLFRTRLPGAGYKLADEYRLEPSMLGPPSLSIANGVLKVDDLSGGTTAIAATYRYRYEPKRAMVRLIGLDATLYSRTYAHDGFEMSWNLLTGAMITRILKLNEGKGDAAYIPRFEQRFTRTRPPIAMKDTPDPEMIMVDVRKK